MTRISAVLWMGLLVMSLVVLAPRVMAPRAMAQGANDDQGPVRVDDRWVYDSTDEVTHSPKNTFVWVVTSVSPNEIDVNLNVRGNPNTGKIIYDRDWNTIESPTVTYKPNDGQGIRLPLEVGKEWRVEYDARVKQTGAAFKVTAVSKVTAKESITTSAGTFDTFKIERQDRQINGNDPSKSMDTKAVMWFAPQINHWVRASYLTQVQRRTQSNVSYELVDYSRGF